MSTYHTTIEDHHGVYHDVEIDFDWSHPIPATHDQPAEGGCEIQGIWCKTKKLTVKEVELLEQECINHAWAVYRGEE